MSACVCLARSPGMEQAPPSACAPASTVLVRLLRRGALIVGRRIALFRGVPSGGRGQLDARGHLELRERVREMGLHRPS